MCNNTNVTRVSNNDHDRDSFIGFTSIRRYCDIDHGIGDVAIIAAPRDRTISCTCHLCTVCQAQTQFTATFARSHITGQHAVRQTMQNGDNYLKDGHLIDPPKRSQIDDQSATSR